MNALNYVIFILVGAKLNITIVYGLITILEIHNFFYQFGKKINCGKVKIAQYMSVNLLVKLLIRFRDPI